MDISLLPVPSLSSDEQVIAAQLSPLQDKYIHAIYLNIVSETLAIIRNESETDLQMQQRLAFNRGKLAILELLLTNSRSLTAQAAE